MTRCLLIVLLLLLAACARPPQPVWTDIPDAAELLAQLRERSPVVQGLDAEASASIVHDGRNVSSQQFLLLQQPDRLRVDALSGFGQLLLQLASDGEVLTVFLNTTVPPRFFRGSASEENLSRFVQLPLPPDLLVSLLLYDPPLLDHRRQRVSEEDDQLTLYLDDGRFAQKYYFDAELRLVGCDYLEARELLLSVRYSRISAEDGFPRRIELEMPPRKTRLALRLSDLQLDPDPEPARFRLQPPDNVDVELLD